MFCRLLFLCVRARKGKFTTYFTHHQHLGILIANRLKDCHAEGKIIKTQHYEAAERNGNFSVLIKIPSKTTGTRPLR